MSQYSVVPYIIQRLREIPVLYDTQIVEDFTSPSVARPVLKTIISVGAKNFIMSPTSRYNHTITYAMRLTFLFPCGLNDSEIAETLYKVSAAFVGRVYFHFLVENAEVGTPSFNSDMYGVKAELVLNMKFTETVMDPMESSGGETYRISGVFLDCFPDKISEIRSKNSDGVMAKSPRTFILEGHSTYSAAGATWNSLHTLMGKDEAFEFSLPRSDKVVTVKPASIETEGDLCGYGFKYKLTFTEVL